MLPSSELMPPAPKLNNFAWEGKPQPVKFVETSQVTKGVECDVYGFENDSTKDLGIIRVQCGCKTPLQKVLGGDTTIEGYFSGKGNLDIKRANGEKETYQVGEKPEEKFSISVEIGDLMQWHAAENSDLTIYEICFPPYADGRFENI
ncbi:MAG: hypothetical protein ABH816_01455 [Candidatus Levyibacteriota bacterium]